MATRPHPPALAHGALSEVLPDVFFVTGTLRMPGAVNISLSRNMTVVREGERLILVNSVRLDDAGLKQLDALGRVTDVLRLAGYHGMDDPFYKQRYDAKVSVVKGQRYVAGFDAASPETYFTPDAELGAASVLPIADARLHVIEAKPPEGLLLLARHGGVLVAGDCLQNWVAPDRYFSLLARPMLRVMGFIKAHNVGPAWLKQAKPSLPQVRGILDLPFEHVLPAHGQAVIGDAKTSYRPRIEAVTSTPAR